jgi:hypothetical protein
LPWNGFAELWRSAGVWVSTRGLGIEGGAEVRENQIQNSGKKQKVSKVERTTVPHWIPPRCNCLVNAKEKLEPFRISRNPAPLDGNARKRPAGQIARSAN